MKNTSIISITILLALSVILMAGCKEAEDDPRFEKLNAHISKMSTNPSESDSTATTIKTILSIGSEDGFETDKFEYFTDTTSTKALVLVRVPDLNSLALGDRDVFMSLIDKMSSRDSWEGKEKYLSLIHI